ncbi:hypothetical protein F4W67_11175 [Pseudomonas caricapapayae]|nr:hypothetical protein F4W67_11175 [Pseudomonas caricapapayae]
MSAMGCEAALKQATWIVSDAPYASVFAAGFRQFADKSAPTKNGRLWTGGASHDPHTPGAESIQLLPGGSGSRLVRDGLRSGPKTGHLGCVWYIEAAGFAAGFRQFADKSAPTKKREVVDRRSVARSQHPRGRINTASARRAWERTCPRWAAKRP